MDIAFFVRTKTVGGEIATLSFGVRSCHLRDHLELQSKEDVRLLESKVDQIMEQQTKEQELMQEIAALKQELKESRKAEERLSQLQSYVEEKFQVYHDQLAAQTSAIEAAKSFCQQMLNSKLFKLIHLWGRIKRQLLFGNRQERARFFAWIKKRSATVTDGDHRFQPLFSVQDALNQVENMSDRLPQLPLSWQVVWDELEKDYWASQPSDVQKHWLARKYEKTDVIMFSVIDYDFRHQRPQHFAQRFAQNGHRVFYINANFHRLDSVRQIEENLYLVDLHFDSASAIYGTDFSDNPGSLNRALDELLNEYAVRDALVIVDYPNWILAAEYLRKQYGFKYVSDYMDDFTGFLDTTSTQLKDNCIAMLQSCDAVIPSSQFLYDIAVKYNPKCAVVRNGTEFSHFNQCTQIARNEGKKVIGYYGAVAHWFDYQKIQVLSKRFPECCIRIVGAVTEWKEQLEKCANVDLVGEKNYCDLPEYLAQFDVCLIPFDTSTDLIKATNPVKFYEYLSAGKKVVASEIPELMPFRDEYVYMSNDDDEFCNYVQMCLDGTDTLASEDARIAFGKENDWQSRYEAFYQMALSVVPKVSVVTITYNNLAYNKACLESILTKTAYANYEVILVDNLSTDGTRDWLKEVQQRNDPRIKVVLNDRNSGFAGGNNLGLRIAGGDYVVLLNNDTLVTRGWMTNLVKHAENDPEIGMVGAVTNSIGNEAMVKARYTSKDELDWFSYRYTGRSMGCQYTDTNMLAMFCTLISRKVLSQCGELDERYGIGMFEDDDYSETVKQAGYRVLIAEDSFVHHFQSLSFSKLKSDSYQKNFARNKALFEEKWGRQWQQPHFRSGVDPTTNAAVKISL